VRREALAIGTLLMLAVLGAAGCTTARPPSPAAASKPPSPSTSTTSPPQSVIDCGTFATGQSERWPSKGMTCLIDAVGDGRKAKLEVTVPTVEGDPVLNTFISLGTGEVVFMTDFTKAHGVSVQTWLCTAPKVDKPSGTLTFENCIDLVLTRLNE
jgi:hypothetical protein